MSEKRKLDHLYLGLKPSLLEKLWLVPVATYDEFLREAERYQDMERHGIGSHQREQGEPVAGLSVEKDPRADVTSPKENNPLVSIVKRVKALEGLLFEVKRVITELAEVAQLINGQQKTTTATEPNNENYKDFMRDFCCN